MRRAIALTLLGVLSLTSVVCEAEGDGQLADAEVNARCPRQMFVGLPERITVKVKNSGSEEWPAAFIKLDDLDNFVINSIDDSSGTPGKDVGEDAHRFGKLPAGASETYTFTITPKDPGNPDLELQAWGDKPDAIPIPTDADIAVYACEELAINP